MKTNTYSRVPEVTLIFWFIKMLSTTVGETGVDFLSFYLGFGMPLVTIVMGVIMSLFLYVQFAELKQYVPANYWSIVVLMSIVGTLITDILVDHMGISLFTLSIVFTLLLLLAFVIWYRSEKTLSIHSINSPKREAYYWLIILLAFALGTAVGDLISEGMGLGYGLALMLFGGLIAMIYFSYRALKVSSVLAFWLVFILTRPLGASLGDFMTKPAIEGGLALNMLGVNVGFFEAIIVAVFYLTQIQLRKREMPDDR